MHIYIYAHMHIHACILCILIYIYIYIYICICNSFAENVLIFTWLLHLLLHSIITFIWICYDCKEIYYTVLRHQVLLVRG